LSFFEPWIWYSIGFEYFIIRCLLLNKLAALVLDLSSALCLDLLYLCNLFFEIRPYK